MLLLGVLRQDGGRDPKETTGDFLRPLHPRKVCSSRRWMRLSAFLGRKVSNQVAELTSSLKRKVVCTSRLVGLDLDDIVQMGPAPLPDHIPEISGVKVSSLGGQKLPSKLPCNAINDTQAVRNNGSRARE